MISFNKWPRILFASILAVALWTFISVNTDIFVTDDKFDYFLYLTSYVLVVGVWALIAVKVKLSDGISRVIGIAMFVLTPFYCMQISMILSGEAEYSFGIYFVNIMFYVAIMALFLAITRSLKWSSIITIIIAFAFNMSSFVVNILRGTPLIPSDFLAIGTAAQVAQNYTFQLRYPIIVTTVITALVIAMVAKFSIKPKFRFKNLIFSASGAAVVLIFALSMASVDYSGNVMDVYDQYHANNTHGSLYSFYINVRRMMLQKPEGYDEEDVKLLLAGSSSEESLPEDKPNIIVIMNESLSDLGIIGDLKTNIDYMPFINSLTKNTVKGQLLVSPFGGYTCNTEFEFLTGLSMGVLPSGATPYLQYISKPYPFALPSHLSDMGYRSVAVHPYLARCWNRQKVYGLLGFDEFISLEGFEDYLGEENIDYIRNYMSDRSSYRALIKQLEEKKDDERLFLFNVTMQNHGGYTYEDRAFPTVTISNMEGSYKEAEQYLSLIRESDIAFEELVNYLKGIDEHTIVVMFGDHMPAVEQEFFEELYGNQLSKLSSQELQKRYTVPFVIWANYNIESRKDIKTSPNYLSNLLLDAAKLPKSEVGDFTDEVMDSIPQINGTGYFDKNGAWHVRSEEKPEALRQYENVEYYMLTRKEEKNDTEKKMKLNGK